MKWISEKISRKVSKDRKENNKGLKRVVPSFIKKQKEDGSKRVLERVLTVEETEERVSIIWFISKKVVLLSPLPDRAGQSDSEFPLFFEER